MTPQELKNSILQLAIQGKLVEQRLDEGTAEELYQQIQAEKQKLIKAGNIKKVKPLPEITDDEKTFDIPEGWKWCRLGELSTIIRGITFPGMEKSREPLKGCIRCATTGSVQSSYNETADVFVPTKYIKNTIQWLENEDIMLSTANSKELVGKSCLWFGSDKMTFGGFLTVARFPDLLFRKYLYYVIQYLHKSGIFAKASTQTTNIANINNDILSKMLVSLPPLAEQKRIVAKIEELLPYIDRYEQAWSKLEDFNKRFPTDMQKSILQMAIQGKLVEQHPEEGTGEELYQQIQAEKQKLLKAGKIKKEKPLPDISEDEKPFDIPESWMWVHIGDLFQHNTGKALNSSDRSGVPLEYITTSNVYWNRFELDKLKTMLFTDAQIERCSVQKGDLLVLEGGDIGRAAIWNYDFPMCIQNHIHRLRPYDEICIEFFYYVFFLYKNASLINGKGIGIKGLSTSVLHKLVIPLPPLAEQKRIVAKLQEILPLCEKLK